MWNKLSGAFGRSRSSIEQDNAEATRIDVMSSVYEQHPNLSVFHTEDQLTPLPSSSTNPPQSISRKSKTIFRRTSNDFDAENERPSSPFSLPSFPKKVKSTLQLKTSRRWPSLVFPTRHSPDTFQRPKSHSVAPPRMGSPLRPKPPKRKAGGTILCVLSCARRTPRELARASDSSLVMPTKLLRPTIHP